MMKTLLRTTIAAILVAALLLQPWWNATRTQASMYDLFEKINLIPKLASASASAGEALARDLFDNTRVGLTTAQALTVTSKVFLPLIVRPPGPPEFEITAPNNGWTVSGMLYFAAQPIEPASVSSVSFRAGSTNLGTDSTPADGFKVFFNAKNFPAGLLQLVATASGPSGQTSKSITVNVVPDPPSSGIVSSQGGVLDSEIGSIITIPPGALPDGTQVSVDELTQQEVTTQNGINWEAMGVTFLGAQSIQSTAPFSLPYRVASANFGNRVQPGQAVVNYQIYPDADGDGVDEIVVVNTASVAPNNDVISDPIPQVLLEGTGTVSGRRVSAISAPSNIVGPPGTSIELKTTGFNPYSLAGNTAVFRSLVDGTQIELPALLSPDLDGESSSQTLSTLIPMLPTGSATLSFRNESTGATTAPITITVEESTPISRPAAEIIDDFFAQALASFNEIQSSIGVNDDLSRLITEFTETRSIFQQLSNDPAPATQQFLTEAATLIENSGILTLANQSETDSLLRLMAGCFTKTQLKIIRSLALVGITLTTLGCGILFTPLVGGLCGAGLTIAYGLIEIWFLGDAECPPPSPTPPCPPSQTGGGGGPTGMGSAPPPGGNGCGNVGGPGGGSRRSLRTNAGGGVIIKVYSAGSPIPFSGVTDLGGYFFVPLIPAGEPFTAVAYDLVNNQTRVMEGIGPNTGSSVFLFFDFFSEQTQYDTVYWDGQGDGTSWHDPFNWNPNLIPGPTQNVIIDVPGTPTIVHSRGNDAVLSLRSEEAIVLSGGTLDIGQASVLSDTFTLSGGTLGGTGTLSVTGVLSWTNGTMSGSGTTLALGNLWLTGSLPKVWRDGRSLINASTAVWNGGYLWELSDATFTNRPGATFELQTDNFIYASANVTFTNAGALVKSAGGGTITLQPTFNNLGSVNIQSGTLNLSGDSTHSGLVQGSGRIEFSVGTHIVTTTGHLNTANVLISSGTTQVDGVFAPVTTTLTNGTLLLDRDVTSPAFTQSGGTLGGTGTLSVTGVLSWTNGTMSGSGTTLALGNLWLTGPTPKVWRDGRSLINAGTAVWNGGYLWELSDATFTNRPGATLDLQSDNFIYASANVTFTNAGALVKSAGGGTITVQPVFLNTGSVTVQTGTLNLSGNSTHSGVVQGSGRIEFSVGTHIVTMTGSLNTANVLISSGTTQVNGVFAPVTTTLTSGTLLLDRDAINPAFMQSGGTLGGTGTLSVTGVLSWTNGTMSGPGTTLALGSLWLTGPTPKVWRDGRSLINAGTAVWNGGYLWELSDATFTNRPGATFELQTDNFIYASANVTFTNAGTLVRSVISGTTTIQPAFNNLGSVTVQTGTLRFGSSFTQGATGILNVQIGGLIPIIDFDQFNVTGLASLDGTLNVTLLNSYVPSPGNSFQIMTFGSRAGQFATVNGNGQPYTANYTTTNVTLVAQ